MKPTKSKEIGCKYCHGMGIDPNYKTPQLLKVHVLQGHPNSLRASMYRLEEDYNASHPEGT